MENEQSIGFNAVYIPQIIEEYKSNPFIEALPPILSAIDAADALTVEPSYSEAERELDAQYRFHCIGRLFRYFQPLDTHIDIENRISRCIRQGYISRNPFDPIFAQRLQQCGKSVNTRSFSATDFKNVKSTAMGFTIIGISGVGKTTAVERVLSLYPQCITHTKYGGQSFYQKQLVWVKLDCPFDGSIKGLCTSFFFEVDKILQSSYSEKFLAAKTTVDAMLPKMAQIASTYGVGVLIIDEIQHLSLARSGGSDKMLNFFVTLVNTIGVPVILIGTTKAMPILQSEFRQARRGSGQGDLLWERMQNDISWEIMLQAMWKYQWTRKRCSLTKALKEALYDESQGIIDIAVKLYAMSQTKAIADGDEAVTPAVIHEVASQKLRLVKPMLDALRSGDRKRILQFEDIRPISIEDYISAQASRLIPETVYLQKVESLEEQAILKLIEMDIPAKTARACVKKSLSGVTQGQPLSHLIQKAFKLALNMETLKGKSEKEQVFDEKDIRRATDNPYEQLKAAGIIAEEDELM